MPQEFQVLQCYKCQTFQVHQVKKTLKWACKLCGEKQSVKKVYGRGTGAECRQHVQSLNTLRGEMEQAKGCLATSQDSVEHEEYTEAEPAYEYPDNRLYDSLHLLLVTSKWQSYVDTEPGQADDDDESDGTDELYTTEARKVMHGRKRSKSQRKSSQNTTACKRRPSGRERWDECDDTMIRPRSTKNDSFSTNNDEFSTHSPGVYSSSSFYNHEGYKDDSENSQNDFSQSDCGQAEIKQSQNKDSQAYPTHSSNLASKWAVFSSGRSEDVPGGTGYVEKTSPHCDYGKGGESRISEDSGRQQNIPIQAQGQVSKWATFSEDFRVKEDDLTDLNDSSFESSRICGETKDRSLSRLVVVGKSKWSTFSEAVSEDGSSEQLVNDLPGMATHIEEEDDASAYHESGYNVSLCNGEIRNLGKTVEGDRRLMNLSEAPHAGARIVMPGLQVTSTQSGTGRPRPCDSPDGRLGFQTLENDRNMCNRKVTGLGECKTGFVNGVKNVFNKQSDQVASLFQTDDLDDFDFDL